MSEKRHPKNAPGPFYVVHDWCSSCGAPELQAPTLMGTDCASDEHGCYFHRQPETADETVQAINAIRVSCCGAVKYGGQDPHVLLKLIESGEAESCDSPLKDNPQLLKVLAGSS